MHDVRGLLTALTSACTYICNLICLFHSIHLYFYTFFSSCYKLYTFINFYNFKNDYFFFHTVSCVSNVGLIFWWSAILFWNGNKWEIKVFVVFELFLPHHFKYLKSIHLNWLFSSIFIIVPVKFVFVKQEVTMFYK